MRILGGIALALLASTGLVAQNRGAFVNTAPMSRGLGVTAFPGTGVVVPRSPSTNPFPGGAPVSPVTVPLGNFTQRPIGNFGRGLGNGRRNGQPSVAYPVYVGGGYGYFDSSYYGDPTSIYPQPNYPQQPNVTVIMPPQQPPVVINLGSGTGQQPMSFYPPQDQPVQSQTSVPPAETQPTSNPYLVALKDHTIYSAIAYWVDNDTLHYFTSGNTHNQVSLSLVDRPLTERLNREMGVDFKLPPAK